MDNDQLQLVHEELLRTHPLSAPQLASRVRLPLGMVQNALGRLKRDRLIQVVGTETLTGHETWDPLPGTSSRRY